ncbi:hypothetical protein [Streptomyces sp. MUM 178J]|uniref:hypothetical protein n=1 Tax=Streptomyces sp. MUM 178J TaxID=2791991 RepID=UPI001F03DDF7|nr:hypothetical protein [Streptomyces sp. MUM 178J]WRQ81183.1 hypothetical protein I3F59_018550 [Streptomyces sp. MUM 178J]
MRGDETQLSAADGSSAPVRRGPRHAAPRKSLLTKLQLPASKALALAAMPTAVFVGMGLTPKLALADDKEIPFAPGPCVTRSDEPEETEEPTSPTPSETPSQSPSAEPSEKPDPTPAGEEDKGEDEPKPDASPSDASTPDAGKQQAAEAQAPEAPAAPSTSEPEQEPEPEPTESKNPLDPLGLGDAIKDLFDGPDEEPTQTSTPTPTPTSSAAETTQPAEDQQPAEKKPAATEEKTEPKAADKPAADKPAEGDAAEDEAADKAKTAIKDAADKVGATVEELDEDVKGLDPKKDEDIPDGAKPRFPCPTSDPEALANAQLEPGIPLLPDDPWILESSLLTLNGLDYHGIVEVKTSSGKIKKVLKFTATGIDIKDLHQLVVYPQGSTAHVQAAKGSTSTIRKGTVTMYTEELKGKLFGIIPITFSPDSPPPLNVPFAFFTNVKVTQAGQFGGTLTVPGLRNFVTGGNT